MQTSTTNIIYVNLAPSAPSAIAINPPIVLFSNTNIISPHFYA